MKRVPLGPGKAPTLPESGYSQTSGRSWVLIDRYLSGALEVLIRWCGYSGPGGDGDHVARTHRHALARHTQRALALGDDEHLLLRVVQW